MSCVKKVKTFETVKICLDEITQKDLIELEERVRSAIRQKLEKLNILIKNANVYSHDAYLFVNDRYKTCADLEEIAREFGLHIKKIDCSLRGSNYVITDPLFSLLQEIGVRCELGNEIANQPITEEISTIVEKNRDRLSVDGAFLEMIANIRRNGKYTATKTREIVQEYYDDRLRSEEKGTWNFNEKDVQTKLKSFAQRSEQAVNKTNVNMLNGTAKLIHSRARQMGYAVEQVKKGKEVQLVLVRLQ